MTKPNWNRLAALEFAGRLLTGRADIRAGEAQAHADWALQWLGGDLPNSERPPASGGQSGTTTGRIHAPGGWVGPPNPPDDAIPFVTGPPGTGKSYPGMGAVTNEALRKKVTGMAEAAARLRAGAPPRNVPVVGDGSMTVPIYRFYREFHRLTAKSPGGDLEPEGRQEVTGVDVVYWREDTRNITNVWSVWDQETTRWTSFRTFDYAPNRPADLRRVNSADLAGAGIPVETRHDSEE